MTTRKRSVLLSVLTLVLCLALVAAGTYALFSDEVKLTNHLSAGRMKLTLKRVSLAKTHVDIITGSLTDAPINHTIVDFTEKTDENVFGLAIGEKIIPQCKYTATMEISNVKEKNDVAFSYWIEIVFDNSKNLALANQLQVIVTSPKGTKEALLSEGLVIGSETEPIGMLTQDTSQQFIVTIIFINDDVINNDAQGQSLNFDMIVHAVQAV